MANSPLKQSGGVLRVRICNLSKRATHVSFGSKNRLMISMLQSSEKYRSVTGRSDMNHLSLCAVSLPKKNNPKEHAPTVLMVDFI